MREIELCALCGQNADFTHHLIFGRGIRPLADEDGLTIPICNNCHNMAIKPQHRIHENSTAEKLSKMLGQMQFERDYIAKHGAGVEEAHKAFMKRYGRSYL